MDSIRNLIGKARTKVRHHGLVKTGYVTLLKALGYNRWFNVLRCHYLEEVDAAFLRCPRRYMGGFLSPRAIAEFTRDPEAALPEEFAEYALAKGDKCYGFTERGTLRAYGWYAASPTRISPDLSLHFSRDYIYMYKAFTHESHRGRRLFPLGVIRALKHYRAAGYKGMLLYVDANNVDSLRSCRRMGFRVFGTVYIAKLLGLQLVCTTPGCARFGVHIEDTSGGTYRNLTFGPKLIG